MARVTKLESRAEPQIRSSDYKTSNLSTPVHCHSLV